MSSEHPYWHYRRQYIRCSDEDKAARLFQQMVREVDLIYPDMDAVRKQRWPVSRSTDEIRDYIGFRLFIGSLITALAAIPVTCVVSAWFAIAFIPALTALVISFIVAPPIAPDDSR